MKELQYTPIVHGEMVTEEYIRNMRAQNYIDEVDRERRRKFGDASSIISTITLAIIILVMMAEMLA